ncbi:hypothetical protein CVT25_013359 [Psilocybe cyanescens]|uniref:Uncharacterized protein n=1 Tax=Psilocybe cyanescens TaxID=93625 RepID=A0A409WT86_PSICY|nr:hypothetical protein CVT25_013359 [Psilocybe cyanescens]
MSAERTKIDNDHDDKTKYHRTERAKPEDFSDSKAPTHSEDISASAQETDRDFEEGQNQGSGETLKSEEGNARDAEPTPNAPVDNPKPEVDFVDEDGSDEDDSDEDDFPRNEDTPRGRVVGPVAGQRPPKPR